MYKINIRNLESYGYSGWAWDMIVTEWDNSKSVKQYHTNKWGDGLWCEDSQCAGTCQFSLTSNKHINYNRIRRYFTEPELA